MKRQIFSILLVAGAMVFGAGQLNAQLAGGCTGTSEGNRMLLCGTEQVNQAMIDAINNCCAGSTIYYEDVCDGGLTGRWNINQDGENSSCAQSEQ